VVTPESVREDHETDEAKLQAGCDGGDQKTCVKLGEQLRKKPKATRAELERATLLFQTACDRKHADGCAGLGVMYQEGLFVTADVAHAVELYRAACEAHSGRGCSRLGALYARGAGVPRDPERALAYSQQGCDADDGLGCANLGLMKEHADGVPRDTKAARELYSKACGLEEGSGCRLLGALYAEGGAGDEPNPKLAVMFSERACRLGDASGCGNAGMNAQLGFGVTQDSARAARLYQAACDLGEQRFCDLLKRFATAAQQPKPAQ
jgi:TPR repeat protein